MANPRFFDRAEPLPLSQICKLAGVELPAGADADKLFVDVSALDRAGAENVSFLDNIKYKDQFLETKAGACFVVPELADQAPSGVIALPTKTPYKAYALVSQGFYPDALPEARIHETAIIADNVKMGAGCVVEAGAVIERDVELGDKCWIGANAVVGRAVKFGDNCRVGANASVSHALIGNNVRIYPGARIGQDGFGFAIDPTGYVKIPQLGLVLIEDGVEIGANTTIDRGSASDTVIGAGSWIDNLVQLGHNVRVGRGCIIAGQVGVAGSTILEDYVMLGGQAGLAGHLHVGKGAHISAQTGVMRDVPAGQVLMGSPALPIKEHLRTVAMLARLIRREKKT